MVGGSLTGTSTDGAPERHVSSAGELSLIRDLRDQLKKVRQELKEVTALVDVSRFKALQAMAVERYLLSKVESIGKSLKCEYLSKPLCMLDLLIFAY
jgi:hypothetical protein